MIVGLKCFCFNHKS